MDPRGSGSATLVPTGSKLKNNTDARGSRSANQRKEQQLDLCLLCRFILGSQKSNGTTSRVCCILLGDRHLERYAMMRADQ